MCERSWLKPLTMSVFMFSLLLGTATFGSFSDTIGRKPVLIFVTISLIACDAVCRSGHPIYGFTFFKKQLADKFAYLFSS